MRRLLFIISSCALVAACGGKEETAEAPAADGHATQSAPDQPTLEQVAAEARSAAEAPASAPVADEEPIPADGEPIEADAEPSGRPDPAPAADTPPAH